MNLLKHPQIAQVVTVWKDFPTGRGRARDGTKNKGIFMIREVPNANIFEQMHFMSFLSALLSGQPSTVESGIPKRSQIA